MGEYPNRLRHIPCGVVCHVAVVGTYTALDMERLGSLTVLKNCNVANNRLVLKGDYPTTPLAMYYEAQTLATAMQGECQITLMDDSELVDNSIKAVEYTVKDGALQTRDIRRQGINDRLNDIRRDMDVMQRKFDLYAEILDSIDFLDGLRLHCGSTPLCDT